MSEKSYLGIPVEELNNLGAYNTAKEIETQPGVWEKTYNTILDHTGELSGFLNNIYSHKDLNVVLTGAGTSAFIGETLEGPFQLHTGTSTRAASTTTLVTHPELYIHQDKPTLLVSFARSGNSPESVHAIEVAEEISENIFHLIFTCNVDGELAKMESRDNCYVLFLPPETNDKSLAMTSSFTSMLLSGLLIARLDHINDLELQVKLMAGYGSVIFENYVEDLKSIAQKEFNRAVFLGSGLFEGIAHESHLKLQELTDGRIVCKYDTFLGFRHGPQAVVDDATLVVYLFSNDDYVLKYEKDLVKSVNAGRAGLWRLGVMENSIKELELDTQILLSETDTKIDEEFLAVVSVLPAQTLAFFKSLHLGLKPDNPSESGIISRVVQGVITYKYEKNYTLTQ